MAQNTDPIKSENEIVANNNATNENIDTSNIFSWFTNSWLKAEVDEIIQSQKKDIFYFLQKISSLIKIFFGISVLLFIITYTYIFIQEKPDLSNNSMLDPFCYIILWDLQNNKDNSYCSSITALNTEYSSKILAIKNSQYTKIDLMLEDLYKIENFNKTKEVIFLKEKTDNRLPVSKIISDFDELISNYEPLLKQKIKCYNIEIDNKYTFKAKCDAYSSSYTEDIKWYDWTDNKLVSWTSKSYANSFLNYIEKQSDKFSHINRQKVFTAETTLDTPGFTNKTNFYLELKYNSNNLSL